MSCQKCGNAMAPGKYFCTKCGAKLEKTAPNPEADAKALFSKSSAVMKACDDKRGANPEVIVDYTEAITGFDAVIAKYQNNTNDAVDYWVAQSRVCRALCFGWMKREIEAIAQLKEVLAKWGQRNEVSFTMLTAVSLYFWAVFVQNSQGRNASTNYYVHLARVFENDNDPSIVKWVVKARFEIAVNLAMDGKFHEAKIFADKTFAAYGHYREPEIAEVLAMLRAERNKFSDLDDPDALIFKV